VFVVRRSSKRKKFKSQKKTKDIARKIKGKGEEVKEKKFGVETKGSYNQLKKQGHNKMS
jgi:hypothetical protein